MDIIEVLRCGVPSNYNYWWHWKRPNGEIFSTGETYPRKSVAMKEAKVAVSCLKNAKLVDLTKPKGK